MHAGEKPGLVAPPPLSCATLLDHLRATYGWAKYRLENSQPGLIKDLDEIHRTYTAATVEERAARYAEDHGIAEVTAVSLLNDMLKDGSLVLELTPSNLLFFLDATAAIVVRAGFKGLAILPDEFQQYFSNGANLRRTVQEFRELVWGPDTRSNQVGVTFSIPTYAESIIQEQGRDILHRLKKDSLYYRLQDIYTQEFPDRLWQRYAETFQLGGVLPKVMDEPTLRSIGQVAEREDLGEGPRTVIDSFKRAIACYQDRDRAYTPIDLIDDFVQANIRFQAQTNKLKTVTRQALDSAAVDTPEKVRAIKLMAAFPRGCPVEVQKQYGLHDAVNGLSRHLHGEIRTHLAEGYTLLGLRPTEGPTQLVDLIITRFWHGYEEDELHLEAAMRAFSSRLLSSFFQMRRGATALGWGNLDFAPSAQGGYVALIEGTYTPRFPRRRLGLQVAYDETQLQPLLEGADLQFDFLFALAEHDEPGELLLVSERVVRFRLNLRQKVGPAMPDDIRKLQDFVNPEFVTPLLMLSLVDYFDRWDEIGEQAVPESDRAEMEHLIGRLIGHTVQLLFNQAMTESVDPPLRRVGGRMLEELFNRCCLDLFPNYQTLFVQTHYEAVLNDYINAMRGMTLKQRRGHAAVYGTKEAMARRFGVGRVATFENRARSEYANLLQIVKFKGRGDEGEAEILLQLHQIELDILGRLRRSSDQRQMDGHLVPVLAASEVADLAGGLGYRDEETLLALQLLAARGYVRFDRSSKLVYLAQVGPDPAELQARLRQLADTLGQVASELLEPQQLNDVRSSLAEVQARFEPAPEDEEELDELATRINDLDRRLTDALSERRETLQRELSALILEVERALIILRQSDTLDREVQGQVGFVQHLNELRQALARDRRRLTRSYEGLKGMLDKATAQTGDGLIAEVMALHPALQEGKVRFSELDQTQETLKTQVGHLERWIVLLRKADVLFNALDQVPDLRDRLTRQVVPEIQAHLTKRKLDGLADWEPFQHKAEAIEEELEERRRHGNEQFTQVKESYEKFLREIEVGDYRPRTRYTYGEDQGTYRDL